MKTVSVIIPVYNEAGNLEPMMERLNRTLNRNYSYEIIFVDDGSMDGTPERLKALATENGSVLHFAFAQLRPPERA
ncbi:MAG: glycosyltransferase [Dysgonamonadaceae bacterium]|jgi:dolichol-phosphate mannosyltransferase|nr:glycosyltransferase [Dysgonamonadaceae bacterium]